MSWSQPANPPPRPAPSSPEAVNAGWLIQDIISRFHEVHRRDFPEAIRLARCVERLNAHDPYGAPIVADHLAMMFDELEAHQQREERILFPAMLNGGCIAIQIPVRRMMAEHDDVEVQLAVLAHHLGNYTVPPRAPKAWVELVALCRKIDQDLREHMRIENEELFAPFLEAGANREEGPA